MGIVIVHHTDHGSNCLNDLYWGLYNINHTGQECCGVALSDGESITSETYEGLVRAYKASPHLKGYCGIGNTSTILDHQPRLFESPKLGLFALTFDGHILNEEDLRHETRELFSTKFQVELAAKLIAQGKDFPDGIKKLSKAVVGPFCLGILTESGEIFIARCPMATRPLVLGENRGKYGAVTESRGFANMDMHLIKDVGAGEIIKVDEFGFHTVGTIGDKPRKICSFLHGYYSWVDCVVDGIPVNVALT
jgi:amidophosphoribosyltransferase